MGIVYEEGTRVFSLETVHSLYQMQVGEGGVLLQLYYGHRTRADMRYLLRCADRGFSGNPYAQRDNRAWSLDTLPQAYSGSGVGDYRVSALQLRCENGSRSVDLRYRSHRIFHGKRRPEGLPYVRADGETTTLEITLSDPVIGLTAELQWSVYEDVDVITRSVRLINGGAAALTLEKAASCCVDFMHLECDVLHFHGRHNMERIPERLRLPRGVTGFGSRRGMSSHHSNPFAILCERSCGEDSGNCWGFMLVYSGNHLEEFEVDQAGSIRVVAGIHPDGFAWPLAPGEHFDAPEVILSFSDAGFNGLSANYHRILRENVIPERWRKRERPVLINSWEACYFDFDGERLLQLAEDAKALGIDMLVLDDGWFGRRSDDRSSLGDWQVNVEKLGCSLGELSGRIHALGMQFGLWMEPEMISEDSLLYRAHPDWALTDPGRKPVVSRSQLVLDMSRQDVNDYLFEAICGVLDSARIEYLKWDFNRSVANAYSHALDAREQGTLLHRFMLGTYRLLERLLQRYPDLMIEGCAGGGGRFDAGMLYYCPQIWCSDDTDAIERLEIQRGTSYGYPASAMGAHVSCAPNHQTGRTVPMATRGIVAQAGALGYELDPARLTAEDREAVKAQIRDFRRLRSLISEGTFYRLSELDDGADYLAWMAVSPGREEALLSLVMTHVRANGPFPFVRLRGLDAGMTYRIEETGESIAGAALMYGGYAFPQLQGDYPAVRLHLLRTT